MRNLVLIFGSLAIGACSVDNKIGENSSVANAANQDAEKEKSIATIQELLGKGDQSACVSPSVKELIIDKLTPDYLPENIQKILLRNLDLPNETTLTEGDWNEAVESYSFFDRVVMTDFNNTTKAMQCEAVFRIESSNEYPVRYTLQPTADGNSFVYKVESPAQSSEEQRKIQFEIAQIYPRIMAAEGNGEIEVADSGLGSKFTASENALIKKYFVLENACRGGTNSLETEKACADRDVVSQDLKATNICYGKRNQAGYQYDMHRCGPDSNGMN